MNPLCRKFGYFLEQNNNDNKNDYDNSNDKNNNNNKKNINNDKKVVVVIVKGKIIIIFIVGCLSHCCFFQFTVFLFTYFCFCPLNPSLF